MVAHLNLAAERGRAFGSYGFHTSLGYTLGPLMEGVLAWAGGLRLLFAVMAVGALPPLPRRRQTVADLARGLADRSFLVPTAALAAALSVGVGFLPVGTGLITPPGFAALAAATPEERMGQTMGSAELGRELGDAGGPLLVAETATVATLTFGYAALAVLQAVVPVVAVIGGIPRRGTRSGPPTTRTGPGP